MSGIRVRRRWLGAAAVLLVFATAAAVGMVGCGGSLAHRGAGATTTTWAGAMSTATTFASASTTAGKSIGYSAATPTQDESAPSSSTGSAGSPDVIVAL